MPVPQVHHFGGHSKTCYKKKKKSQPRTITCKHRQFAQEWRLDIKAKSTLHLLLYCHHQNDSCIKVGSGESYSTVSLWNWCRNLSQHRKLTLEKNSLLPLLMGLKPTTFQFGVQCSTTELSELYNTSTQWTKTSFKTQSPTQVQGRRKTWNRVFENALLRTLSPLSTTEPACMFVYVTVPNRNSIRMVACLFAYVHVCVRTCMCVLCLCVRVCAHMRLVCVCCGLSVCLCMCLHVYIQY